jgi:hypothetical protein
MTKRLRKVTIYLEKNLKFSGNEFEALKRAILKVKQIRFTTDLDEYKL